jgi:CHASE3 domain sensor protein
MRSRAARLSIGAAAFVAIVAASFFIVHSEKQIADGRAAVRAFDLHARDVAVVLADVRVGQQAYVASGQGIAFWMPKVAATTETAATLIAGLRQAAQGAAARASLDEAATTVTDFGTVDKRARDYIRSGQQLMAADVIFTEGGEAAATAARQVEAARLAEAQAHDASESATRTMEAAALAGAGVLALLAVAMLVPVGALRAAAEQAAAAKSTLGLSAPQAAANSVSAPDASAGGASARAISPVLRAAAQLCTDFGRINDLGGVSAALAQAADLMDATGLIVWLGSTAGADLRPALAHGYPPQVLARMPTVPRSADNAAAAAYRTGELQIVLSRPGGSNGAVVAPIVSPEGCIGALSAEIAGGGETSDSVQALAAIVAAQLAGVLQTGAATEMSQTKTASA